MTAESFDFGRGLAILTSSPAERSDLIALVAQLQPAQRATCPKCGSTSVQVVNIEKKNLGAAVLAEWMLDSTAAGVAAGSKMVPSNACVACGFQWLPGSLPEALARLISGQLGEDNRKKVLAQVRRREQEQQVERKHARRNGWILAGVIAALVGGAWAYSAYLSPAARERAQDLQRTDVWVSCVLAQQPRSASTCGAVPRTSLNAWFEHGHMDVLADWPVRARLESLTTQ